MGSTMMNMLSRLWGAFSSAETASGDESSYIEPSPVPVELVPRMWENERTFTLETPLSTSRPPTTDEGPMLYLQTSCAAIANYCFLGRRSTTSKDNDGRLRLYLDNDQYLEVCLRMRRCGAVRVNPKRYAHGECCDAALGNQLNRSRYIFGWPESTSLTSDDSFRKEPVWVSHIFRKAEALLPRQVYPWEGMEGFVGADWLARSPTMEEYCSRLQVHGGVYYSDVSKCPQARELGLCGRGVMVLLDYGHVGARGAASLAA
ncbi:uncharacterized protein LTR77_001111 [Saxophila tyrrhenica]|uniref:Uncharacterized protein n=1 Tax=Saxophila tyrrhenica TaxID=1690608 RepID=A0AAV9PJW6_9PEZI|nr:hypothetical protein LTR77_001111 [Saxophila tyrrhenica]